MTEPVIRVEDQELIDIIRDLVDNTKELERLGLKLGREVTPIISLNPFSIGGVQLEEVGNLLSTEFHLVPAGRMLVAVLCVDVHFAALKLELSYTTVPGVGWETVPGWALPGNTEWAMIGQFLVSDGARVRLFADGEDINAIQYLYSEV